jgi:hypothetical protein
MEELRDRIVRGQFTIVFTIIAPSGPRTIKSLDGLPYLSVLNAYDTAVKIEERGFPCQFVIIGRQEESTAGAGGGGSSALGAGGGGSSAAGARGGGSSAAGARGGGPSATLGADGGGSSATLVARRDGGSFDGKKRKKEDAAGSTEKASLKKLRVIESDEEK